MWEPILGTDFAPPGSAALARIEDRRAAQFWDPLHLFALELQRKLRTDAEHPQPTCCDAKEGIPWDMIVVYRPGARWETELPRATYADGPVWKVKNGVRKALTEAFQSSGVARPLAD